MVKNFWLLHKNHDNKVAENAMFQVRTQKKAGSKLLGICLNHLWEMII